MLYLILLLGGVELVNYIYYKYLVNFCKKKRYFTTDINIDWSTKLLTQKLNKDELLKWLNNTIYHKQLNTNSYKYFTNVNIQNVPRGNIYN